MSKSRFGIKSSNSFITIITKQIDDTTKRARSILQRTNILLKSLIGACFRNSDRKNKKLKSTLWTENILLNLSRLKKQQEMFIGSMALTSATCLQIREERLNHIMAIETARNKRLYSKNEQLVDEAIIVQGKEDCMHFMNETKKDILGTTNVRTLEIDTVEKLPRDRYLKNQNEQWQKLLKKLVINQYATLPRSKIKQIYRTTKSVTKLIKAILKTIHQIRQDEWTNSKTFLIQIGKFRQIARMTNPKARTGPVAARFYPTKPNEHVRKAFNDIERKEASLQTHALWMNDPPGRKNCHFLDTTYDEIGPNGINIVTDREFDNNTEWQYLEGMLSEKVYEDTAERKLADQKLPKLFQQIKIETKIVYPFKYDCITGKFLYPDLEKQLRKNAACSNGKARATGFAIPVLGQFPKIFIDSYILKCKLQMTLRLLDTGTECSLQICIGKPCGGVRPLTVGHDDNVFLNGLAQQAIQKEIARLNVLPPNIVSYQKGKGCADTTIIDLVVKENVLQNNNFYLAELSDDAEKMFDRLYMEIQIALLMLAGAGIQGFMEWQSANMVNRTNGNGYFCRTNAI